jgi:hypothetical protein
MIGWGGQWAFCVITMYHINSWDKETGVLLSLLADQVPESRNMFPGRQENPFSCTPHLELCFRGTKSTALGICLPSFTYPASSGCFGRCNSGLATVWSEFDTSLSGGIMVVEI